MFSKPKFPLVLLGLLVLTAALAAPSLVNAGGWAVVSLDTLPGSITAGEPYTVGMTARQHGRTPWQVEELLIEARQVDTGQSLTFTAAPEGAPGHYQAELLFPEPGRWEWEIATGLFPMAQPLPALEVAASSAAAGSAPAAGPAAVQDRPAAGLLPALSNPAVFLGTLVLLALAAAVLLVTRAPSRRFRALAGAGLLLACGAVTFAFISSTRAQGSQAAQPTQSQALPVSTSAAASAAEEAAGRQLFLAKGCVVCHINDRAIKRSEMYSVNAGPNLTAYLNDADYLRRFLADPQAAKSAAEMPDLDLSEAEIEALVSFINDHEKQ